MERLPVPIVVNGKKSQIVTHSNKLNEARYFLTVGEQKIILLLISMISPDDTDFKDYEMKVSDFSKIMGLSGNSVYERLNETLDKLLSRVIHIPKETGFLKIGWVSAAEYIEGKGTVFLSFDKKLKPYLLKLKEQFTQFKLLTITQFKSAYTIRIYMLLKQYETIGFREFELNEFREILGINKSVYQEFKAFRQWVLNQAKKEFETKNKETGRYVSDITFELKTIRTGREITHLRFDIKKQVYQEPLSILDIPEEETKKINPALEALEKYGIKGNTAKKYLGQQEELEILRCVALLEQAKAQGKVQNSESGYLLKLLEARAGKETEAEKEAKEKIRKKEELIKERNRKKQEEEKRIRLGEEFSKMEHQKFLNFSSEEEKKRIFELVKAERPMKTTMKDLEARSFWAFAQKHIDEFKERKERYIELNM